MALFMNILYYVPAIQIVFCEQSSSKLTYFLDKYKSDVKCKQNEVEQEYF